MVDRHPLFMGPSIQRNTYNSRLDTYVFNQRFRDVGTIGYRIVLNIETQNCRSISVFSAIRSQKYSRLLLFVIE